MVAIKGHAATTHKAHHLDYCSAQWFKVLVDFYYYPNTAMNKALGLFS